MQLDPAGNRIINFASGPSQVRLFCGSTQGYIYHLEQDALGGLSAVVGDCESGALNQTIIPGYSGVIGSTQNLLYWDVTTLTAVWWQTTVPNTHCNVWSYNFETQELRRLSPPAGWNALAAITQPNTHITYLGHVKGTNDIIMQIGLGRIHRVNLSTTPATAVLINNELTRAFVGVPTGATGVHTPTAWWIDDMVQGHEGFRGINLKTNQLCTVAGGVPARISFSGPNDGGAIRDVLSTIQITFNAAVNLDSTRDGFEAVSTTPAGGASLNTRAAVIYKIGKITAPVNAVEKEVT